VVEKSGSVISYRHFFLLCETAHEDYEGKHWYIHIPLSPGASEEEDDVLYRLHDEVLCPICNSIMIRSPMMTNQTWKTRDDGIY
jgi:hypothetical protein